MLLPLLTYTGATFAAFALPIGIGHLIEETLPEDGWKNRLRLWSLNVACVALGVALALFVAIPLLDLFWSQRYDQMGIHYEPMFGKIFGAEEADEVQWIPLDGCPVWVYDSSTGKDPALVYNCSLYPEDTP